MTTYPWAILAILLLVAPRAAASEADPPLPSIRFEQHQADGDRARLRHRWQEALDAYDKALAIRYDAVVTGYSGVVLAKLERFDLATRLLQRACTDTTAPMPPAVRQLFFDEFVRSSDQVCRVDVHVDQANARVEIDETQVVEDRSDFYVFLNPGVHTFVAQKPGFHDAVQTLTTDRACRRKVALIMQSIPIEQLSLDTYLRVVQKNLPSSEQGLDSGSPKSLLSGAKPPPNPYESSRRRWFVGGGAVWIPFGMTPGMGVGLEAHAGARLRSYFEISLETKGLVNVTSEKDSVPLAPGSAFAWSFGLGLCGRILNRAFFCGVPQLNGGDRLNSGSEAWLAAGFGGRLGLEFHPTNRFDLRFYGEFTGISRAPSYGYGVEGFTWEGKQGIMSLGMTFTFFSTDS